jgi:hypothetical protein
MGILSGQEGHKQSIRVITTYTTCCFLVELAPALAQQGSCGPA